MIGHIESLWRYPVKGFTPERLTSASLAAGAYFPCDRLYAVEDGPSGFDPAAPAWVSKQKFTVLARIAEVARARTAFDEVTDRLMAEAPGHAPFSGVLSDAAGRDAFAHWLAGFLGDEVRGPLKVVLAPGHRFTDDPEGYVSIVNLASVRDLSARMGREVSPLRFRANLHVEGWPAWAENAAEPGSEIRLGAARATLLSPIVRCAATHVDPETGERDMEVVRALFETYGHRLCGIYVSVTEGGDIREGDAAEVGPIGERDRR